MRKLMLGLLFLSGCVTPHWDAPREYTVKQARADEYQCELDTRTAMASFNHYISRDVVLGHKDFDERFYGRCLVGKGWRPGTPVEGGEFPQRVTFQK